MLLGDRQMSVCPTPIADRRQRAGVTLLCRYLPHHVLTLPRLSQTWQKPRKVNVVPSVSGWSLPSGRLLRKSTKRVLSGWSVSSYRASRLPNTSRTPLGILKVCERHHGVISKTDKGTVPLEPRFHLVHEPLIQHMMQEDVR